jgi:hypothetical protein
LGHQKQITKETTDFVQTIIGIASRYFLYHFYKTLKILGLVKSAASKHLLGHV